MQISIVLVGLLLSLVIPGMIAWVKGPGLLAIIWLLLGMILGSTLLLGSGTFWLQRLSPDTFESQGGGITYITFYVPFFVGTGLLVGAWSVAWGYVLWAGRGNGGIFQIVGLIGSVILGGLLPLAIPPLLPALLKLSDDPMVFAVLLAIANGVLSPGIVYLLTAGLVTKFL